MAQKNPLETVPPGTYIKRKSFFQIALVICIIGFLLLTVLAKYNPYLFFDPLINNFIQNINIYGFNSLMRLLSLMGNNPINLVLTSLVVVLLFSIGKRKDGLTVLASVVGIYLLSFYLKILVSRPRPDPLLTDLRIPSETSMSFPSGHVLFYIGLFGVLLFLEFTQLKLKPLRRLLSLIFISLIILIGFSRIYLGVHWFSDVLASYFIGFIWVFLIVSLYRRFN